MSANLYNGSWKNVNDVYVYVSGWKQAVEAYIYVDSAWKQWWPGTTTTTTTASVCNLVSLGYNHVSGDMSCSDFYSSPNSFRMDTADLSTALAIYSDTECTTYANSGYYSNGEIHRHWVNNAIGESISCPATTTTSTTQSCNVISLGYDASNSANACNDETPGTYYINTLSLTTASKLYTDSYCTNYANSGYYSIGWQYRYWTGSAFSGAIESCPATTSTTTTTICEPIYLGYSSVICNIACDAGISPYRINAATFAAATKIYWDSSCTEYPATGYYSDGNICKNWDGETLQGSTSCASPTTTSTTTPAP